MSARTLIEHFKARVAESGDAPALKAHADGAWRTWSFAEWQQHAQRLAAGLADLGVGIGDRVAVLSSTRVEWAFADFGVLYAGAVVVPIYETVRPRQARIILEDSGSVVVFVENPLQLQKLVEVIDELDQVRAIVLFDVLAQRKGAEGGPGPHLRLDETKLPEELKERVMLLSALLERGTKALGENPDLISSRRHQIAEESLASIVYTAGTTGRPRGVVLSHGAFVAQIEGNRLALPLKNDDVLLLFLPVAQILARLNYMTMAIAGGLNVFSRGITSLDADIAETSPTVIVGVPRVFQKMYERISRQLTGKSAVKQRLLHQGEEAAQAWSRAREGLGSMPLGMRLWHTASIPFMYQPMRRAFGARFRFAVSGGAPIAAELLRIFDGAGVKVLEGYGLTEHCAAASVNRMDDQRVGSVGRPLPGVEVRIASDGEILLRSQCVMRGYWNDPQATAEALAGAWLHTGDIGEFDGTYLRITDRKKDVIVTDSGRSIPPSPIEALIEKSPYIDYAMIHGDGRPFLSALVTLNETAVREWAAGRGIKDLSFAELSQRQEVFELVGEAITAINGELPGPAAIQRYAILPEAFSLESGELTATWKTRRTFVTRKYQAILDGFYAQS